MSKVRPEGTWGDSKCEGLRIEGAWGRGEGGGRGSGANKTWGVWRSLVWLELELEWVVVRDEPREVNRS